jgi:outer membrane protein assembly factor BamB
MVYLISGFRGAAIQAVKLDAAEGDVTGTDAVVWSHDKGTPYIPSALLSGRNLYFLKGTGGILSCVDAVTGEVRFDSERIEIGNIYASIVGAAGRVYVSDREGTTLVLKDGPSLEVLATNTIDEGINATPAIVGDTMFIRGSNHLYCVARTAAGMDEAGAE